MTTAPAAGPPAAHRTRMDAALAFVLFAATLAVYAPVRHHAFVNYDDPEYVVENTAVRAGLTAASVRWALTSIHHATWHPLTGLSHMLDVQLFGLDAGAYLLVNAVLHALSAVVLFAVLQTMTGARSPSAWVAGVFALHPLHVESVAWVSERKDVLSGLFWMLTMAAYVRYARRPSGDRLLLVVIVYALGLAAKPMLVTLPCVLLLLDVWPLARLEAGGRNAWTLVREKVPLLTLAAVMSVVTYVAQTRAGAVATLAAVPLATRVANALLAYVRYLRKAVWPSDLAVFYPLDPTFPATHVLAAAAGLAAVTVWGVRERRRRPYLLVGWLWYLGTLVPVIGLVRQGDQAMADRFTYLPLIGVAVMVAFGARDLAAGRRTAERGVAVVAIGALVAAAIATARQLDHWRNSTALFAHALAVTTDNYVAHANYGAAIEATDPDAAYRHYAESVRANPRYAKAHVDLGAALARRGELAAAEAQYAEALRLDPGSAMAEYDWGRLAAERGDLATAIAHYRRALDRDPRYAKAWNNLGWAQAERGELAEAEASYRQALGLAPELTAAHNNLAVVLERQGRTDDALAHYAAATRLTPDEPRAHANYASVLAGLGRYDDAIAEYRTAVRLEPGLIEAHQDLAAAYAATGRFTAAAETAAQALALARAAGRDDLTATLETRLVQYRAGVPGS